MKSLPIIRLVTGVIFLTLPVDAGRRAIADEVEQTQIEEKVRATFQQEMKSQEARIAKAEADLQRIKNQFEKRLANAEAIIKQHAELLGKKEATAETSNSDVPASVLSAEGWKAWQKQDWREALSKFELAVKKDPKAANTINGLGWTYLHLGEHAKAIAAFEKAIAIEPAQLGAMNGIGQSLIALGRLDEAKIKLAEATHRTIDQMGEAGTVKNEATASWFTLVRLLVDNGDNEAAIEWAKRFLKHKPDDAMMKSLLDQAQAAKAK